jgi:diguanylate cyclase (GGDEF)-like protein
MRHAVAHAHRDYRWVHGIRIRTNEGAVMLDQASSPALGDLAEREPRQFRARLLVGFAFLFGIMMLSVGLTISLEVAGIGDELPILLRLGIPAVLLPPMMVLVARRLLAPAEALEAMTDRLRSLYSQARLDALLDPITGLGNHRAFQEELHRQIEDARRSGDPVALVLIDLDDLKRVNDERGHAGGDQLLAAVGRLIHAATRASDRSFRIGGDEFALLLPRADVHAAHGLTRRLLASALDGEAESGAAFSFSAGVSAFPTPSLDGRRLFRQADAALYWAKRHGRTDVQIYDPERHGVSDDTRSTPELAAAVDALTAARALTPVFQPIYDLRDGHLSGFEGLVRPGEDAGFRDATALFVAAEAADRTVELDMVCLETIATSARDAVKHGYLSLNVSPRSLETEQFRVMDVLSILQRHKIPADRVVLELTERETVGDIDRLRANLQACRDAGMRTAADDVGAGNAGLRLLSEIGFDVVKIDLSLVQGGVLRDSALAVLRGIQELAERTGASVVAEGIETVEQLEVVRSLGIHLGQGFLLAPPLAAVEAHPVDLDTLVAAHQARHEAILNLNEVGATAS